MNANLRELISKSGVNGHKTPIKGISEMPGTFPYLSEQAVCPINEHPKSGLIPVYY
jgi:hypothetical protein